MLPDGVLQLAEAANIIVARSGASRPAETSPEGSLRPCRYILENDAPFRRALEDDSARTSAPSEEDAFHEFDASFFSPALRRMFCNSRSRGASRRRNGHCPEPGFYSESRSCPEPGFYSESRSCPELHSCSDPGSCPEQPCSRSRAHPTAFEFYQQVFTHPADRADCSRHGSDEE